MYIISCINNYNILYFKNMYFILHNSFIDDSFLINSCNSFNLLKVLLEFFFSFSFIFISSILFKELLLIKIIIIQIFIIIKNS